MYLFSFPISPCTGSVACRTSILEALLILSSLSKLMSAFLTQKKKMLFLIFLYFLSFLSNPIPLSMVTLGFLVYSLKFCPLVSFDHTANLHYWTCLLSRVQLSAFLCLDHPLPPSRCQNLTACLSCLSLKHQWSHPSAFFVYVFNYFIDNNTNTIPKKGTLSFPSNFPSTCHHA